MINRIQFEPYYLDHKLLTQVAQNINDGKIVIFPTDSVYAMGCIMTNKESINQICKILDKKEKQAKMSLICPSISKITDYTTPIPNTVFRVMKRYLPGPYTFILKSNNAVQKFFKNSKEEIGVRIPDHIFLKELLPLLNAPLISTSLSMDDDIQKHYNDPEDIAVDFQDKADILIDMGIGDIAPSTVINCSDGDITLLRQGKGAFEV